MISIIIPTLNEAAELPATLSAIQCQQTPHEVLVVDAGSTDATISLAGAAGARVLLSSRAQRAAQMNLGAAAAGGEILLFLHADTRLAPGALKRLADAMSDPQVVGGGFARRYDDPSLFLRLTCALAELRTRVSGWFLGDQAIFVRRENFTRLGGFREMPVFEDLDFARRLARHGRVVTLRPAVISAARRFRALGPWKTTCRDLRLTLHYLRSRGREAPSPDKLPCAWPKPLP